MNVLNLALLGSATSGFWYSCLCQSKGQDSGLKRSMALCLSCTLLSCGLQTWFLLARWLEHGTFPLSNLYESLFFLSWGLTSFVSFRLSPAQKGNAASFGSILMPVIVLINGFMVFLPPNLKVSTFLVPALQSNWLQMHVGVMIAAYAFLILGCLFAIGYLVLSFFYLNHDKNAIQDAPQGLTQLAQTWDNYSYRTIGLGFPLLTMGLLSGAVWANQTWGSYWSWDPKETWALIAWFIFAIYLHTRISKAWSGRKSAWLAVFGFVTLWICYLGVNLMAKGLHSYGFFH
jgi:cytochrome c-type biogenesis protein CcsB